MATKENALPELEDGEIAEVVSIAVVSKKTKPPTPYTEGTLLDDMKGAGKFIENDPELKKRLKDVSGLGTAATRDSVIEGLKHDKYLEKSGKYLVTTPKGKAFIEWLQPLVPELTDVAMTARWEADLDLVAQEGGGLAFEKRIEEFVRQLVVTLKSAPAIGAGLSNPNQSKEKTLMSDTEGKRASKPTDKMLDYAKKIASKMGQRIPDEVMSDFDACREFIDQNKDAAMRPSEKQLKFADSIAQRKGLTVPEEGRTNSMVLSKWIDENL